VHEDKQEKHLKFSCDEVLRGLRELRGEKDFGSACPG
jgi:hypothetical protein